MTSSAEAKDPRVLAAATWFEHRPIMRLLLIGLLWLSVTTSHGASLAGQQVQGGGTAEIRFPVAKYFQDIAAEDGNPLW
jgi:hypothetical protein